MIQPRPISQKVTEDTEKNFDACFVVSVPFCKNFPVIEISS